MMKVRSDAKLMCLTFVTAGVKCLHYLPAFNGWRLERYNALWNCRTPCFTITVNNALVRPTLRNRRRQEKPLEALGRSHCTTCEEEFRHADENRPPHHPIPC